MQNNRRYDLSDRLIHFFRNIDLDVDTLDGEPGSWSEGNLCEDSKYSANFMMRCVIRSGQLWATWSVRNGVRTIYGPRPAICFTEMPTAAFLETSALRQRAGQKITTFALTFPKDKMFSLGARPVIYSLSDPTIQTPSGAGGARCFPGDVLSLHEQYRYVTYAPTGNFRVDWTHEREWRWPHPTWEGEIEVEEDELPPPSPLMLYESGLKNIGMIVNKREEADRVIHDVLSLVDRKVIAKDTFSYVLIAEDLGSPAGLRNREDEEKAIASASIDLSKYQVVNAERDKKIRERVFEIAREIEAAAAEPLQGEFGGCWLWLVDNTHEVTRALVNCQDEEEREIIINRGGKYLMFPYEFSDSRNLRERENMTIELANRLNTEFGVEAGYYSVLVSDDPDGVPYYNSDFIGNRLHYNFASDGL